MRIRWIDIAKGLGIILVTMGHTRLSQTLILPWITSFHMPLFFFVAGLCYDENRYDSYFEYLQRKARALLYPYVTLSVVVIALLAALCFDVSGRYNACVLFRQMLQGNTIGPFWFIPVLLMTELLYGCLTRCVTGTCARLVFCVLCVIIALNLTNTGTTQYRINTALFSMGFYGLGHAMTHLKSEAVKLKMNWLLTGVVCLLSAQVLMLNTIYEFSVQYVNCVIGNPWLFHITSLLGISATTFFAIALDKFDAMATPLAWLGRNSIVLFIIHGPCGVCRQSWGFGWWGYLLEYALMITLVVLLTGPLKDFVVLRNGGRARHNERA